MTEREQWQVSEDPRWLLNVLIDDTDPRRWRLTGAALMRCPHPRQHLGGLPLTPEEWEACRPMVERIEQFADAPVHWTGGELSLDVGWWGHATQHLYGTTPEEMRLEATLIRDVWNWAFSYGPPPFPTHTPPPGPALSASPDAISLALAAYEHHDPRLGHLDPVRLAVLSDALEEAGGTDKEVLDHLRSPGPHVRGCWAVDLVLGRT
jgi:hypothetical protein